MYRICLVEDEPQLNDLLTAYIEKEGYEVVTFIKGTEAYDYIGIEQVHLWVLDIMLEGDISGYDIIKKIREADERVPVIFTSARDKDLDKILGLELGSDDYIAKPFSPKELILRINNFIKKFYEDTKKTKYGIYELDFTKRSVKEKDKEINLTTLEFDLLTLLVNNQNHSFSRDDILNSVWGSNYCGNDRVVDDLFRRLRKKMPGLKIQTIYGYGYRLV